MAEYADNWNQALNFNGVGIENPNYMNMDLGRTRSIPALQNELTQVGGGNSLFGNMSTFDKFNTGLQTIGSALAAFNGYKANKLAKQQLAFQKDAFNRQFTAQKNITNSQFSERQARRVNEAAANGYAAPTSVADYMDKYGVK